MILMYGEKMNLKMQCLKLAMDAGVAPDQVMDFADRLFNYVYQEEPENK